MSSCRSRKTGQNGALKDDWMRHQMIVKSTDQNM